MIIAELFERLGLDVDAKSFAKGALAAKGVEIALTKIGEAARWVTDQLEQATFGVFEQADNLDDLAAKTGVTARALQDLGYAGSFADVSTETLAQSLRILQRTMVGAIDGNKELKAGFKSLKVDLVDSTGKVRDTEDVFSDLADRFADMPSTAARTAAAMKIFGKSGAELLPLLLQGGDGIREMTDEFRDLGGEFSGDLVSGSAKFQDNMQRLKTGMQGVRNTIAEAVLPAFNEIAQSTLDWVKANRDLIRSKVTEWAESAVATVRAWVKAIREWVDEQGGLSAVIDKVSNALKIFATFLVVAEVLSFAASILKIVEAFQALKIAVAANPLGLFLVILAATVTAIYENWGDIKEFFELVWDSISGGFSDAADYIYRKFEALAKWITDKLDWVAQKAKEANDLLNPFAVNDTSSSGTRGATVDDPEFAARLRAAQAFGAGAGAPSLTESRAAPALAFTSAPTLTITTHPGQSAEEIARIAAREIEKSNRTMLREAQAGLQ